MRRLLLRFGLPGLLLVVSSGLTWAADLMEPWDPGLSNMELYFSSGQEEGRAAAAVLGLGLPAGFSFGVALSNAEHGATSWAALGMYTHRFGTSEIDLYAEAGVDRANEAEVQGNWLIGGEWSLHRRNWVPYLRATGVGHPESGGFHGLAGLMMPVGDHLELHLELSSEAPVEGAWPVHLAVGPNLSLPGGVEVLPEISMLYDRDAGATEWLFTVGVVFNPQSLRRSGSWTR